MISEKEIKCVARVIAFLEEACLPVLTLQGLKNPEKSLPKDSLFPGRGLNSRTSTYEAACRPFECDNPPGFLFLYPSRLQMFPQCAHFQISSIYDLLSGTNAPTT